MVHHFLFVLFLGLASTGLSSDVVWVHAGSSTAGHADTCLSARLSPTDELFQILWDVNVFNGVVADLNMKSSGLKGCCAAGLWCLNGTCFTQGYGVFMNHGPLINSTAVPVYTCFNRNSAEPSPQILSASFSNGSLTVIGNELGYAEESTLISAAGPNCYEIESCSRVCRPCSLSSTCGIGSACFSGNCYQYCSGIFDLSCPCDYTCQAEYLYSNGWSVPIFVCSPNPVDIGGCPDSVITTQMEFRCSAPQLLYVPDEQEVEIGFIIESKSTTGNFIIPVHKSCAGNTDCFDNNICTVDVCNMASLTCEYNPVASCESTAFRVREHQYSTVYDTLAEYGMGDMHQSFVTKIRDSNHVSSVSIVDDAPHEYIDIGFNFSYFGSVFSRLAINPNGAISFPPFQPCELMAYPSFDCILHKSDSNTISVWYADWDPSASSQSNVYYLQQRADDASSVYGVSGVNAFHILYDTMYRFRDEDDEKPQNPNTFSLSIYEDASIRVRYHKIETTITTTDTFGMWGSRSSSSEKSNLYYHNEMLSSTSVSEGLDYVYCSSNVLACPVRSCVSEGETLNMYWTGTINCAALGNDIMRSYECAWAGGLAVTDGFVDTFDGRQTLSCRVPQLRNISDGELMTVEITTKFILTPSAEKKYNISIVNNNIPAQKSVYALTDMISMTEGSIDEYGDLTKHSVMIRYYSAGSSISLNEFCGCSPLSGHNYSSDNSVCDLCGVCRSAATEQHPRSIDCNGDCFGRAYVDDCGNCSAGSTMIEPDNTCNNALYQDKTYDENLIGQLIFIMVVVCFMSCVFSVCVYFSRTIFTNDHQVAGMDFIFVEQTQIPVFTNRSVVRGLSAFERDALGTVKYDPRASHSEECAICLLSLEPGDICRVLPEPCGHCFHVDCVDKWFQVSPACPLCKRSIKKILLGEPEFMSPINFDFSNFGSAPEPIPSPMVRNNDSEDAVGSIDSAHSGIELVVSSRSRDGAYDRV